MSFMIPGGSFRPLNEWDDLSLQRFMWALQGRPSEPSNPIPPGYRASVGIAGAPDLAAVQAEQERRIPYARRLPSNQYMAAIRGDFGALPSSRLNSDIDEGMFPDQALQAPVVEDPAPNTQNTPAPVVPPPATQSGPPAAATTATVQPPAPPAATTPAAPASNPVTAALGGPAQPPPDPFAEHRAVMHGFEGDGVNPRSGASGFGQVRPNTYADWVTRFGARFPWMPRTLEEYRNSPRELQERVYNEIIYPNEYQPALQNAGLEFTPLNAAVVNFLGPTGGVRFLQGANQNPSAPATSLASPAAVDANRNVFFDRDGRERNAGEVLQFIAQGSGGGGGALTVANRGTADERTNAAATNPEAAQPTNPYRERLLQLLTSIEGERNSRPDTGELLLRMGSGILSGRDLMDGLGRGGAAVAELMQQTRQDNARRDQTLVGGFQGLVNDRRFQEARTTFGAPTNVRWIGQDGREIIRQGMTRNGEVLLQNGQGQWVPAFQVTGTNDYRVTSRNDTTLGERGWQNIPNARDGSVIDTLPDGRQILEPSFEMQGVEANRLYLQTRNLVSAGIRLDQMERAGVDPARFSQAISRVVARTPEGANVATIAAEFARLAGITDEEARIYTINSLRYLNAAGRISSGAAITRDEWGRFEGEAVARYGDPAGVLEELRTTRNSVMRAAASSQGPAAQFLMGAIRGDYLLDRPFERRQAGGNQTQQRAAAPTDQNQGGGNNEPRIIEQLNASTINALRDDERVRVRINGQLQEVTGAQLKAELARRQGQQR